MREGYNGMAPQRTGRFLMRRACFTGVLLAGTLVGLVGTAMASGGIKLCVPKREGGAIVTPKHGKCRRGYKLRGLGAEGKQGSEGKSGATGTTGFTGAELETLRRLLPHIKYIGVGVGGKPTVQFSGVNVQIVNGEGKTATTNGEGNLVIGYDERARTQTGSHDLVLGEGQEYTSFGGVVAGYQSTVSGEWASVTGGSGNMASGEDASVGGGGANVASDLATSVSGGVGNWAGAFYASVSGGQGNHATGEESSVSGGFGNKTTDHLASVSGGYENTASGEGASVSGGEENKATSLVAWIGGGLRNEAYSKGIKGEEGKYAAIFGGKEEKAALDYAAIP
jgi:hypothetical protein